MKEKVELVLIELIKNYLNIQEPISSAALKRLAQLEMSPSTIRVYFQNLEKMGMIEKEHFASGSYPSIKAMEFFWKRNFPQKIEISSFDELKEKCKKFKIGAFIKVFENQMLKEVYNVHNKFIVLEFENDETIIKYDTNIFNLLKSLKYLDSKELIKIFKHYKLLTLTKKIKNFQKSYMINQKLIYNKLNLELLKEIDDFYINYNKKLVIKKYFMFDNKKEMEIYLVGDIYSNFLGVVESMKGGDYEKET